MGQLVGMAVMQILKNDFPCMQRGSNMLVDMGVLQEGSISRHRQSGCAVCVKQDHLAVVIILLKCGHPLEQLIAIGRVIRFCEKLLNFIPNHVRLENDIGIVVPVLYPSRNLVDLQVRDGSQRLRSGAMGFGLLAFVIHPAGGTNGRYAYQCEGEKDTAKPAIDYSVWS
jgi:hypothetical protein